ncbi:ABC transporter substrate-binding protein [Williamsia sp. CHRR-6]|uniref:ABC transporter substrate-binding protein n=1 Tax=Williamsia sp. CHRR-6 TaxID=2835871 RepID=UPI001BDA4D75|nr:ABC transporter substrate-binding protein [Williamsia sp. CHRR-6]MBT0567847.1 ABC transporter substrate-binding protein [Williamsia sp. CHRR-6]
MAHVMGRHCVVALAVLALLTAGCSDDNASTTSSSGAPSSTAFAVPTPEKTSYPLTIDNCGQKLTFSKAPSRVVILNGTSVGEVETFIELGLEKSIYGNAQSYGVSDDPGMVAKIKALPTGGLTSNKNFDVPAEQLLAAKPDLVVSTWSGGFEAKSGFATRDQLTTAGIPSYVNPDNCAFGKSDASPAEKKTYAQRSIDSSYRFMIDLGRIFDVQAKAAEVIRAKSADIAAVEAKVAGLPKKSVLIAYPGMSMMNSSGLPAVFSGGVYDDILNAAGARNSFPNAGDDLTSTLNAEKLAAANVDVLAIGLFTPDEDGPSLAQALFDKYPQWSASKNKKYVIVSDSVYFGPLNNIAVRKIAQAVHPDAGL